MARAPEEDRLLIILANGDSYESEAEEAGVYLKLLGTPADVDAVGYAWNFQGAKVDLINKTLVPLSYEQATAYMRKQEYETTPDRS